MVAGFSELTRLNLAMYSARLTGTQNTRDGILPPQTRGPRAGNRAVGLPLFADQFVASPSAVLEMTLQTSTSLNRLALEGYVALHDIPSKDTESMSPRRRSPSR
ncbi:hypothetical protein LMG27952_02255 [Paraburkholderia hiiakae]|uniref:Uncharacterized protein n=2 Tax=Paraburkholderia hiiakae TaxID=1081782 RepID=A0ABM8NJL8_9BURK|nr:hypothetical protein LMG27952_02255 [Paraburkholderia hiiakae]